MFVLIRGGGVCARKRPLLGGIALGGYNDHIEGSPD